MNWPPLTDESSYAIADVLREAVTQKPVDLIEFVAKMLEERSGLDPGAFEADFEQKKKLPRRYVLEDRCPANQDPLSWVSMRFNDDTILLTLQQRAMDVVGDILRHELIDDSRQLIEAAIVSFPELMYLRDSEEELVSFQVLRAIYVGCSPCDVSGDAALDDADPRLSFRCESLVAGVRGASLFEGVARSEELLQALIVVCFLHVLGRHPGYAKRYGGAHSNPSRVILHAIQHEARSLPSYQRLSAASKELVVSVLKAHFTLSTLLSTELSPALFGELKDSLGTTEGLNFFSAVLLAEHMVVCRNNLVTDDDVDRVRLGVQCIAAIEKYGAQRAYQLYLKKRAERHMWRLVKDDFQQRAVIRLCCLSGQEDDDTWNTMQSVFDHLEESEKEILKNELGRKDGIVDCPVFLLVAGADLVANACANPDLGADAAVKMIVRILGDATKSFVRSLTHKVIRLHVGSIAVLASNYSTTGGGTRFEDTPILFEEQGFGEVLVKAPCS
eukprot:TRINITY_DN69703_c0_g1_i1.p1 TRINITY_DN69703_c0_g1~~TRINITY_DN69703_c0_g1_i1.p1  ORF type:complete len:501 (+),score=107.53 TRINITY_DN69703_c0_g1_i1:82-1584(+)